MSIRLGYAVLLLLAAGGLVPVALGAQVQGLGGGVDLAGQNTSAPAPPSGDTVALAFEREVFTYPEYSRRNPFKTLLTAEGGGPRFENLLLLGILYSPYAGESVAVFGEGTRTVNPAAPGVPESVTVELTGGTYRVREGATIGSLTVRLIERQQVIIEVLEFGVTESRVMVLSRGTSGGGR